MEYFSFKSNEKKASDFYKNKLYFSNKQKKTIIGKTSFACVSSTTSSISALNLRNISSSKTRFNRKLRLG